MLFYPAALPLSSQTLSYVAGVIRRHRRQIGSAWRKLSPGRQALLVLAYLRKGETFADLAAGFGVGTATAWRYVRETVALLAARSPKLRRALADAKDAGHAYLVIDGTLVPIDRVAADRPFYSGKHRRHGMNLQVIATPGGDIVWVSGPLPGAVHDLTAARIWGIIRELAASGLVVLADKGYHGAGDSGAHPLPRTRQARLPERRQPGPRPAAIPGERANAQLKTWRILRKLRCCPWRAGQLAKAIHVLQARDRRMKKAHCLAVNTQLRRHPGDLPVPLPVPLPDLEHHLHRALAQLLGVFPLCWHDSASSQGSEPPRFPGRSTKPGTPVVRSKYGLLCGSGLVFSPGPGACQVAAIIGNWLPWGVTCRQQERRARLRRIWADGRTRSLAIHPVSRGAMGRVWCLDLGAERYAVKELFCVESDEESVRPEVAFTAHLDSAGYPAAGQPARPGWAVPPGAGRRSWWWLAAAVPVD